MKVLVAPVVSKDDDGYYNSLAVAGELVIDPGPCACDDSRCDVDYVFLGVASGQPTTEAVVADLPFLDVREFRRLVGRNCCTECDRNGNAEQMANRSRFTANRWPVGSVVVRNQGETFVQSLGSGY